jgi:hypothetical protein
MYKFLRSARRATRSDGDRDQCFVEKMKSSSLTPDSCICYPPESHISRGIDCPGGLAALRIGYFERLGLDCQISHAGQHHSHRAQGIAFAGQKQLYVTTFLEAVVRPGPAGLWACSKHVPRPCAAPLIPCSHRDNSVPKVSVRQRASAKLS